MFSYLLYIVALVLFIYIVRSIVKTKNFSIGDAIAALGVTAAIIFAQGQGIGGTSAGQNPTQAVQVPTLTIPTALPTQADPTFTPAPTPTLTLEEFLVHAQEWPTIVNETFNPETQNWTTVQTTQNPSVTLTIDGRFNIKVVTNNNSVRESFYHTSAQNPNEFLESIELVDQDGCDNGLTFRGTPGGEYYSFVVGRGEYEVVKLVQNERQPILERTELPESIGTPNNIQVIGKGQDYYFYINNTFINKVSDGQLNGQSMGLEILVCQYIPEGSFIFDNFIVRAPSTN